MDPRKGEQEKTNSANGSGQVFQNRYTLSFRLGSGSAGDVLLAYDKHTREMVAIKKLVDRRDRLRHRFHREYQLLSAVEHPNLVKALDFFQEGQDLFMVLEYCYGRPLSEVLLAPEPTFSLLEQLAIANKIARAVEVLNAGGIIHRDIKPGNIIVDEGNGDVKLVDLGIGRELADEENLTVAKAMVGTLPYMSPEQTRGELTGTSDVFCLGVTLHQFFLWRSDSPFFDVSPVKTFNNIHHLAAPDIYREKRRQCEHLPAAERDAYRAIAQVVAKAMEKRPGKRWQNCGQIAERFAKIHEDLGRHETTTPNSSLSQLSKAIDPELARKLRRLRRRGSRQPIKKNRKRSLWLWLAGVSIALGVVVGIVLENINSDPPPPLPSSIEKTVRQQQPAQKEEENSDVARQHFADSLRHYNVGNWHQSWQDIASALAIRKTPHFSMQKARLLASGRGVEKNLPAASAIVRTHLSQIAADDDVFSIYITGVVYYWGVGVEKDYRKAIELFRRAAQRDYAAAMTSIGSMYSSGAGVMQNQSQAISWYKRAAELGNGLAMENMAGLYLVGQGVPRDYEKALKWLYKASDLGGPKAMLQIGTLYLNGNGLAKDPQMAHRWFQKAVKLHYAPAMAAIGTMYLNGLGFAQDYATALQWYRRAAELGDLGAISTIAYLYLTGQGVGKDYREALRLYQEAAAKGYAPAIAQLGTMYMMGMGVARDYNRALQYLRPAARANNAVAMNSLGSMYAQGLGVEQNYGIALQWYRKAAAFRHTQAMNNIGLMYSNGLGVERDYGAAMRWFRQAANLGYAPAMKNIAGMYEKGRGVPRDPQQAREWRERAGGQ